MSGPLSDTRIGGGESRTKVMKTQGRCCYAERHRRRGTFHGCGVGKDRLRQHLILVHRVEAISFELSHLRCLYCPGSHGAGPMMQSKPGMGTNKFSTHKPPWQVKEHAQTKRKAINQQQNLIRNPLYEDTLHGPWDTILRILEYVCKLSCKFASLISRVLRGNRCFQAQNPSQCH